MPADLLLLGILMLATTVSRAFFERLFDDFGAAVPDVTKWLMSVPSAVFLAVSVAAGLMLVAKEAFLRDAAVKIWVNVFALLVLVGFAVVIGWAFLVPLNELFMTLS